MSDQNVKKNDRRYIGKIKTYSGKNGGVFQKILMDNTNHQNADGTPNKYYSGTLVWYDAKTGKGYQVKQMSIFIPRDGMKPELVQQGFSCFITLDLEDNYQVTVLA